MANYNVDIGSIFSQLKDKIALEDNDGEMYLPNIIDFCESKHYLNLSGDGIFLFPIQKIILKTFYRGRMGNENLALTDEELKLLFEFKLTNVIEKYHSGYLFRELILVLGRRSGKDFLTSLIALYEAMKLMECPNGSPFDYYGIASGNPIYILTVATSSDQARILFTEIKTRMQASEYFKGKVDKVEADRVWLLTPEDKKKKKELIEEGLPPSTIPSSVVIMSGHSNSEGLLGKRIFALLLDEVASFKTTGSALSGDRIYSALTPATVDFKTPNKKQPDGSTMYDSKIISISSPRAEEGILYKLYIESNNTPSRLSFKLPTWRVNLNTEEDSLRQEFKFMNPVEFQMEFGAEFSGTAGELFIPAHYVDAAFQLGDEISPNQKIVGRPGMIYYAHLDPAATSHNYALIVMHIEERTRIKEKENGIKFKEKVKIFVVDHIMAWQPAMKDAIEVGKIDQYILDLAKVFRFAMVSYDDFHSLSSIQKLRAKGVPSKITKFRKAYKVQIYTHLEHLLINHQISFPRKGPWSGLLERELKCLKRVYNPSGFKIEPDPEAQTNTDDICDALAGACGIAVDIAYSGYPKSGTVYLPQSRDMGQAQWNIGSGKYNNQEWNNVYKRFGKPSGGY